MERVREKKAESDLKKEMEREREKKNGETL